MAGNGLGNRRLVGKQTGLGEKHWGAGGWVRFQAPLAAHKPQGTASWMAPSLGLLVPAWPAASVSPHQPRLGPVNHARAVPLEPAQSLPGAAWHPQPPSAHPPALSPASEGHWRPVLPPGGLAPAHVPGGEGK